MAIKYSVAARNTKLTALNTEIGASAKLRIYSGTRPANVAAAITGTLLAELTCNATAFGAVATGALTANAITADSSADATGTATHFRIFKADGVTACVDGDVAASGADLNLSTVSIVATGAVSITSFVITENNG